MMIFFEYKKMKRKNGKEMIWKYMDRWLREWVDDDYQKREKHSYEENWWRILMNWWKPLHLPMYNKRK